MYNFLLRQVLELSLLWSLSLSLGEDLWARFLELGVGIIALFFLNDTPAIGAGLLVGLAVVSGLAEKSACFSRGGNSDLSMSQDKSDWGFSISQHAKHKAEPPSHWWGLGRRSAHLSAVTHPELSLCDSKLGSWETLIACPSWEGTAGLQPGARERESPVLLATPVWSAVSIMLSWEWRWGSGS